jgi:predicted small secreted protein
MKLVENAAFPSSQELAQIVLYIIGVRRLNPKIGDTTMRPIIFAILMLVLLGTNVACNTVHGFGQDVERLGEKTQDAADRAKRK